MQLYQLAIELDERSADVAERAQALGLGAIDPTSQITDEQADTLRAAYGRQPGTPVPVVDGPITRIGPPTKGAEAEAAGAPLAGSGRLRKVAIGFACILGLGGLIAFFAAQSSPAEERREQLAADMEAWDKAPPATVAPDVAAAVTFPADQPRDRAKLCAARSTAFGHEHDAPELDPNAVDWSPYRAWAADRTEWRKATDTMIATGPTDAVPDITDYRDIRARYYAVISQASDSELRALADGIELNALEGYERDVNDARADVDEYLTPICGPIGG